MKKENYGAKCTSAITSLSLLLCLFVGSSIALVSFPDKQVAHAANQFTVVGAQGKTGGRGEDGLNGGDGGNGGNGMETYAGSYTLSAAAIPIIGQAGYGLIFAAALGAAVADCEATADEYGAGRPGADGAGYMLDGGKGASGGSNAASSGSDRQVSDYPSGGKGGDSLSYIEEHNSGDINGVVGQTSEKWAGGGGGGGGGAGKTLDGENADETEPQEDVIEQDENADAQYSGIVVRAGLGGIGGEGGNGGNGGKGGGSSKEFAQGEYKPLLNPYICGATGGGGGGGGGGAGGKGGKGGRGGDATLLVNHNSLVSDEIRIEGGQSDASTMSGKNGDSGSGSYNANYGEGGMGFGNQDNGGDGGRGKGGQGGESGDGGNVFFNANTVRTDSLRISKYQAKKVGVHIKNLVVDKNRNTVIQVNDTNGEEVVIDNVDIKQNGQLYIANNSGKLTINVLHMDGVSESNFSVVNSANLKVNSVISDSPTVSLSSPIPVKKTGLVDPEDSRFTNIGLKFSRTVRAVVGKQIVLYATEMGTNQADKRYEYRYTIDDENVATGEGVNCTSTIGLDKFIPQGDAPPLVVSSDDGSTRPGFLYSTIYQLSVEAGAFRTTQDFPAAQSLSLGNANVSTFGTKDPWIGSIKMSPKSPTPSGETLTLGVNHYMNFSATVAKSGNVSTELTWQIIGAENSGTTLEIGKQIDADGVVQNVVDDIDKYAVLHLAPDETAKTIFVMAKSVHNSTIYDFSAIDVVGHVNIDIKINGPETISLQKGSVNNTLTSSVSVPEGISPDILWSIVGLGTLRPGTTIVQAQDNTMKFNIDDNEESSFIITASLAYNTTKKASVLVQLENSTPSNTEVSIYTDSVDDTDSAVYDLRNHNASTPMNLSVTASNPNACSSPGVWEWEVTGANTTTSPLSTSGEKQDHAQIVLADNETSTQLIVNARCSTAQSVSAFLIVRIIGAPEIQITLSPLVSEVDLKNDAQRQIIYSTQVQVPHNADNSVIWNLHGNASAKTQLSNGVLTVSQDETAKTIIVSASLKYMPSKSVVAFVNIVGTYQPELNFNNEEPNGQVVSAGASKNLQVTLSGAGPDTSREVIWSVVGAIGDETSIMPIQNCPEEYSPSCTAEAILTVGAHEVAYNLTVIVMLASNHQVFTTENIDITGRQNTGVDIVPNNQYNNACHQVDFNESTKQIVLDIFDTQNPCRLYYDFTANVYTPAGVEKTLIWSLEGAKYSTINPSTGRITFSIDENAQVLFVKAALVADPARCDNIMVLLKRTNNNGVLLRTSSSVDSGLSANVDALISIQGGVSNLIWEVYGGVDSTTITEVDKSYTEYANGTYLRRAILNVSPMETASSLYILARSVYEPSAYSMVEIKVNGRSGALTLSSHSTMLDLANSKNMILTSTVNFPAWRKEQDDYTNDVVWKLENGSNETKLNKFPVFENDEEAQESGAKLGEYDLKSSNVRHAVLEVSPLESESALFVIARSSLDSRAYDFCKVSILGGITKFVTITPESTTLDLSKNTQDNKEGWKFDSDKDKWTLQFHASVSHKNTEDKLENEVQYEMHGGSVGTKISADGLLEVSKYENSHMLQVVAISKYNSNHKDSATVAITGNQTQGVVLSTHKLHINFDTSTTDQKQDDLEDSRTVVVKNKEDAHFKFDAKTYLPNSADLLKDGVTWELSGGVEGTKIDQMGNLTVANDEVHEVLFVTARQIFDNTRFDTATVYVHNLQTSGVAISPRTSTVSAGKEQRFSNVVSTSIGTNRNVVWEVYGGVEETTIDNSGLLKVSANETADAIFVTARLIFDPTRFATAIVNVADKTTSGLKILTKNAFTEPGSTFNQEAQLSLPKGVDKSILWDIYGSSANTKIDHELGIVEVDKNEVAPKLFISARSKADGSKRDVAILNIVNRNNSSITVTPRVSEVKVGATQEFNASVHLSAGVNPDLNWELYGNTDSHTTINKMNKEHAAVLKVGTLECADSLVVLARSKYDSLQFGFTTVKVGEFRPAVTLSPKSSILEPGNSLNYTAHVLVPYGMTTDVQWEITGKTSDLTTIGADGSVQIGFNEKATNLVITAKSKYDSMLFDTAVINLSLPNYVIDNSTARNQMTYIKSSAEPIYLNFDDSPVLFDGISIDGKLLDKDDYSIFQVQDFTESTRNGILTKYTEEAEEDISATKLNTVVFLKPSYLDKLESRQHLISVSFKNRQDMIEELNIIEMEQKDLPYMWLYVLAALVLSCSCVIWLKRRK
ncbi:MAG: hypothetical protein LBI63_00990 [Candidatus Ancillula sp.]|jgi:hypothetical protein|nr:hypothetical protein [Candidatus Ancillula sp.]